MIKRPEACIVIVPPWPNSGSANIFAAIVKNHALLGRRVLILVGADEETQSPSRREILRRQCALLNFDGATLVTHTHLRPKRYARGVRRYTRWITSGFPDSLRARAARIGSAFLSREAEEFIAKHEIRIIHVNHCFNMLLARKLTKILASANRDPPLIVCDTHDIQANNKDIVRAKNPIGIRSTEFSVRRTEIAILRRADILCHISMRDMKYFEARIPRARHVHMPPTIAPAHEAQLVKLRGRGAAEGSLVYVGSNNFWNMKTLIWLLEEVLPRVPEAKSRLAIYGDVGSLVAFNRPDLVQEFRTNFRGTVASLVPVYEQACGILAPSLGGTGSSIKVIEALSCGRPVLVTSASLRGLEPAIVAESGLRPLDDAGAFAEAIRSCLEGRAPLPQWSCYDRHFSSAAYSRAFRALLSGVSPLSPLDPTVPSPAKA